MCTDYPTCSTSGKTPFDINQQKYSLATSTSYSAVCMCNSWDILSHQVSGACQLSATSKLLKLDVPKVNNGTVTTRTIWWGIQIPSGTVAGVYDGLITITAYAVSGTCGPVDEPYPCP